MSKDFYIISIEVQRHFIVREEFFGYSIISFDLFRCRECQNNFGNSRFSRITRESTMEYRTIGQGNIRYEVLIESSFFFVLVLCDKECIMSSRLCGRWKISKWEWFCSYSNTHGFTSSSSKTNNRLSEYFPIRIG